MQSGLLLGNFISPLIDVYNKQTEKCIRERHKKSMHTSPNSIQIIFIMTLQIYMPNYGAWRIDIYTAYKQKQYQGIRIPQKYPVVK
jgi:hypothetical protein